MNIPQEDHLQSSKTTPKRRKRNKGMCLEDRPVLEPNAAGIDVGAREMFVAVPPGRDEHPVQVFATFTEDLERLADWLLQCGVTTVAMESTGVYWIPLYEILEQRGIRPCLVNARHMKNVPGRRTDWHECQWLQFLHSVGLLRAAFRPGQDVCAVRTILRHRNELVAAASQHVQHMHKALTQMNLQIHHVISDITGSTGRAIVDAILAGQAIVIATVGHRTPGPVLSEATQLALGLICILACTAAFRRSSGIARYAWRLLAVTFVVWSVAQVFGVYLDISGGHSLDSLDDILFFLSVIPFGLLAFLDPDGEPNHFDRLHILDFVQVCIFWVSIFLC